MSLQSIKFRLTLFCFIIGLFFSILVLLYYPLHTKKLLHKSSLRDYQFINGLLQKDLITSISKYKNDNGKTLRKTLQAYQELNSQTSRIIKISIFDSNLLYLDGLNTQDSDKIAISYKSFQRVELNELYRMSGPLLDNQENTLGYYRVDYSKEFLNQEVNNIFNLAMFFGFSILVLVILVSLLFSKFIVVRPLSILLQRIKFEANESLKSSEKLETFSADLEKLLLKQIQGQKKLVNLIEELDISLSNSHQATTQAFKLSQSSDQQSESALETMEKMGQSIQGILQASHDTEKVVASIEEIAKKSDVLTLNAFVEVRRSGEAGKVFAVIAEEIRKLTSQSTHAVNSTSNLVKSAIEKSQHGVNVSLALAETYKNLAQNNQRSFHLSAQIEELSKTHAEKIMLLNNFTKELQQSTSKNDLSFHLSSELNKHLYENSQKLLDSLHELDQIISGD
ncbi:MAG: hypothetical protein KC646_07415 [Candidatus Cloacimonetes bacterium]|nr:hypothetical protein [Candidatus Cloacimonadota bacterium]